ncbi:MAG: hypothetical protein FWB80_02430 [Defluviitaleaceae bacterium]|nr:hypothetical protein [Defluviitaleaceae bacterium]
MKMCNTEIMKKIKLLEQSKFDTLVEETRIHEITYQNEKDRFDNGYSFADTREKISKLDAEIRKLKSLLNLSNATTVVPEFSMTLGECLVYLAQLNRELAIVSTLANKEAKTTRSTYGGAVEYTVINYDKTECKAKLEWLNETIAALQIAIDRVNLTNIIEIK